MAITALTPKPIPSGQLPSSKGTLYTVPGSTTSMIARGTLTNTSAAERTVNVYLKTAAGTSKNLVKDRKLQPGDTFEIKGGHFVDAGGLIEGDADAATSVDYYFSVVDIT